MFELLVVLAVVALLFAIRLPALAKSQSQTKITQCAGNLRQLALALEIYGNENNDRLPTVSNGSWAWDIPPSVTDALGRYGAGRSQLYCPANPEQNNDGLWAYTFNYRIIGYVIPLPGNTALASSNLNATLTPQYTHFATLAFPPQSASSRVLAADAILSQAGQNLLANKLTYTYTGIQGGAIKPHRSSHMGPRYPLGSNLGMLDGHVEWRRFQDVLPRNANTPITPCFWW